jgi:allantoinase
MAPRNSESVQTSELLTDTGYRHTLNWCHDERHWCLRTSSGKARWAVAYPQGLSGIPMIVERH